MVVVVVVVVVVVHDLHSFSVLDRYPLSFTSLLLLRFVLFFSLGLMACMHWIIHTKFCTAMVWDETFCHRFQIDRERLWEEQDWKRREEKIETCPAHAVALLLFID